MSMARMWRSAVVRLVGSVIVGAVVEAIVGRLDTGFGVLAGIAATAATFVAGSQSRVASAAV